MKIDDFATYSYEPGGRYRWDFLIDTIRERDYKVVCEVGVIGGERGSDVNPGINARMLLVHCSLDILLLVDTAAQPDLWGTLYNTRAAYMQISSIAASKLIADQSLDLVFIDANHDNAREDIIAWFPKVRVGGILCGHDYGYWAGLKEAVNALIPDVLVLGKDYVWWREITPGLTLCGEDLRIE